LKNIQFWSRSRKAKISTAGIYLIFRGLKFEPDIEIGQKGTFFNGLKLSSLKKKSRRWSSMPWPGSKIKVWRKPIFILGFFIWTGSVSAMVSTPSIQLPVTDFNFGEVEEGAILSHEYLVKNTGLGVLEIRDVRPG
jgi:hypothetical protein